MTWELIVERKGQSVLISSYFYNGIQAKYFEKLLGIEKGFDHYLIVKYKNYYRKEDVDAWKNCMIRYFAEHGFEIIAEHLKILKNKAKELLEFSEDIKIKEEEEIEKESLVLFKKFSQLCLEFAPAMYYIIIESIIEKKMTEMIEKRIKSNQEYYFSVLTQSNKPTDGTIELISLYKIAKRYYNNDEISELIKKHLQEFCWISFTKFVGEEWTEEIILERIKKIKKESIEKNILELKTKYAKQKEETKKICVQFGFTKEESDFISLVQEVVWFRTFRIDVYTKTGFNVKNLFRHLAEKLGLSLENFVFLTYKEVEEYLKQKRQFPVKLAEERRTEDWQLLFDKGTMTFQYAPPYLLEEEEENNVTQIKGKIACKGYVQGEVQVIRGVKEFYKMKNNAILVTSMTTPDFVPLMERSGAIITDEGGITCHAAIVARELKIPCIIGTKNATRVLKDGDLVEVDAEKGTVKKL